MILYMNSNAPAPRNVTEHTRQVTEDLKAGRITRTYCEAMRQSYRNEQDYAMAAVYSQALRNVT